MRELTKLGEQRTKLRADLRRLDRQAAQAARAAFEAGTRKQDIATALCISRPTLDKMLRD